VCYGNLLLFYPFLYSFEPPGRDCSLDYFRPGDVPKWIPGVEEVASRIAAQMS